MQPSNIEPNQPWTIDIFKPEDAEGVAALFLEVYGRGYPIKTFIDPERLKDENARRTTISSVAKTPRGDIIGHNAIFSSAPSRVIYELGSGVVHPSYRGGAGIFTQLNLHGLEMAKKFGVAAIFGEPVCNHVFAQKMGHSIHTISRALEIDLLPAEAYEKEKSSSGRVGAFQNFKTVIPRPHQVYLPTPYEEALRFCYDEMDDQRDFARADQPIPEGTPTTVKPEYFEFARVARLAFRDAGTDFRRQLEAQEAAHVRQGAAVIQVWLKMTWPWLGEIVSAANDLGYFFGGALPRWFDDDGLLLQKTFQKPNFEGLVIHFDRAKKIYEFVKADWSRLNRESGSQAL
ncbi:MAG: hypothetical protein V1816_19840 [Pseudomonadota bacterium]